MPRVIALVVLVSLTLGVAAIGQSAAQTCSVQAFFASPRVDGVIESELIAFTREFNRVWSMLEMGGIP